MHKPTIGFVAPSSVLPMVQFELGVERIVQEGFSVQIHPQCKARRGMYAGTHEERARAIFEFAHHSDVDVIWCARGGYGANFLLPILDRLTTERGRPRHKLLVGYSDATALFEYVRRHWGWATLHAPMPSLREFSLLSAKEMNPLFAWISREREVHPFWEDLSLKWVLPEFARAAEGVIEGGNLAVWASLLGTPYQPDPAHKILFFEEVGETFGRVDRLLQQLALAGVFKECQALIFGDWLDCRDAAPSMLKKKPSGKSLRKMLTQPKASDLKPLRPLISEKKFISENIAEISRQFKLPVATGLPIGHGKRQAPLPLGAEASLSVDAKLSIRYWNWNHP